jgi:uncharacterized delta-60 repeat protein
MALVLRFQSDGTLDTTFGGADAGAPHGWVLAELAHGAGRAEQLALQADGKIVTAGLVAGPESIDIGVARFTSSGVLDPTFGHIPDRPGRVVVDFGQTHDHANGLVLQKDGKIVVSGFAMGTVRSPALFRLREDGTLDDGFGAMTDAGARSGKVITDLGREGHASGGALTADGKILITGSIGETLFVARYTESGDLDGSFGTGGLTATPFSGCIGGNGKGIAVDAEGRIIAGGSATVTTNSFDFAVARYSAEGSLDPSFGRGGRVTTDFGVTDIPYALALQPEGKILLAGSTDAETFAHPKLVLARYLP